MMITLGMYIIVFNIIFIIILSLTHYIHFIEIVLIRAKGFIP